MKTLALHQMEKIEGGQTAEAAACFADGMIMAASTMAVVLSPATGGLLGLGWASNLACWYLTR